MATKTRIQKKIIDLKPVNTDLYCEYVCPLCGCSHWISQKEAGTRNFKIVCDCDVILQPKRISGIKIKYFLKKEKPQEDQKENKVLTRPEQPEQIKQTTEENTEIIAEEKIIELDSQVLRKACENLIPYGFEKKEAEDLIKEAFNNCQENDISILVKRSLQLLGNTND